MDFLRLSANYFMLSLIMVFLLSCKTTSTGSTGATGLPGLPETSSLPGAVGLPSPTSGLPSGLPETSGLPGTSGLPETSGLPGTSGLPEQASGLPGDTQGNQGDTQGNNSNEASDPAFEAYDPANVANSNPDMDILRSILDVISGTDAQDANASQTQDSQITVNNDAETEIGLATEKASLKEILNDYLGNFDKQLSSIAKSSVNEDNPSAINSPSRSGSLKGMSIPSIPRKKSGSSGVGAGGSMGENYKARRSSGSNTSAASDGPYADDGQLPGKDDDDLLAQQIREAAISEEDPELKAKLWKEYRTYKGIK